MCTRTWPAGWLGCRRSGHSMIASMPPTARPGWDLCHFTKSWASLIGLTSVATSWNPTSLICGAPQRSGGSTRTAWLSRSRRSSDRCAALWPSLEHERIGRSSFAEMSPPSPVVTKSWVFLGLPIFFFCSARSRSSGRRSREMVPPQWATLRLPGGRQRSPWQWRSLWRRGPFRTWRSFRW